MNTFSPTEAFACRKLTDLALAEDLGHLGDRTSDALIPVDQMGRAVFVARSAGVIAGLPAISVIAASFRGPLTVEALVPDGTAVSPGAALATFDGPLRTILIAERIALNFLQRLSGIATLTQKYVDAIGGTKSQVFDTRKTTPGWRLLEKYAVRMGGGSNHRLGLFDGILIKDNHLAGLGDPTTAPRRAIELARAFPDNAGVPIEIEVDTLEQLEQVLPLHPEMVLLDNMSLEALRAAVARRDAVSPTTELEASGGVNLSTIRAIAETGVDRISVGALTHSAPALDVALDYERTAL